MFHAPIIYYWIEILYPRYIWRLLFFCLLGVFFYGFFLIVHLVVHLGKKIRASRFLSKLRFFEFGGVGGIRTHARGKPSNDLANRPLQPAWVPLH